MRTSATYAARHSRRISRVCHAPCPSHKPHMPRAMPSVSAAYTARHARRISRVCHAPCPSHPPHAQAANRPATHSDRVCPRRTPGNSPPCGHAHALSAHLCRIANATLLMPLGIALIAFPAIIVSIIDQKRKVNPSDVYKGFVSVYNEAR